MPNQLSETPDRLADQESTQSATGTEKKSVFIKTYGCQMNVYDSDRMADVLSPAGYAETLDPATADLVILNTCHIREKAAEKVYSELGRLRALKEERERHGGAMTIGVAGCVAQAEGEEMVRRAPVVDLVVGPQSYHRLPDLLKRTGNGSRGIVETDFPVEDKFDALPALDKKKTIARGRTAFLTVQEGCDKFCAFCVVPYTRGAEFSRPVANVIQEAKDLVAGGVREITLLGQNVNAYHGEGSGGKDWSLGRLIYALAEIDGIDRLRYTTSHPRDMDDELIRAHGEVDVLMPYLHLPAQSGSNNILTAMNRQHDAASYLRLIERIRGEVGYAQAYSFKYSPRPGTPAAGETVQVEEAVKAERLARLQDKLNIDQAAFNKSCEGRTMSVLLDRRGKKDGQLVGRSPYLQSVHVDAPDAAFGHFAEVTIDKGFANSLSATLISTHRDQGANQT